MAEHARLSKERLKLIRSFIGELAGEGEEQSDFPCSSPAARFRRVGAPRIIGAGSRAPFAHATERVVTRARARSQRKPTTGVGPFPRYHFTLRWPIAAIVLGVIIGVLMARVAS